MDSLVKEQETKSNGSQVIVRTSVKHPFARNIMAELEGKISPILGKPYTVIFES